MWSWHEVKLFVEHSAAVSFDALHVIAGVIILLIAALVSHKPLSSWWPWSVVFALACLNELIDLWIERWPQPGMQYGEGAKDLLLTMVLPTVLMLGSRRFPRLYEPIPSLPRRQDNGRGQTN